MTTTSETATMTVDEMALRVMLSDKGSEAQRLVYLTKLAYVTDPSLSGGDCPECGALGPHMDNGEHGSDRTYCCESCGCQWDAAS